MTDYHIHFGQFYECYYHAADVLNTILEAGVDKCYYSSTSSCIENIWYSRVEREIENVVKDFSPAEMQPLLWYVPDYIHQELRVEKAFAALPYKGFKLHSGAHHWDLKNTQQLDCLHSLFDFSDRFSLPVLIHTGENELEKPNYFERFFAEYQNADIILAHCRPVADTIRMFEKYPRVKGDTSFVSQENLATLTNSGFASRLLFGTDFPITHYFNSENKAYSLEELQKQYKRDIQQTKDKKWI